MSATTNFIFVLISEAFNSKKINDVRVFLLGPKL
jgi:hypothetical protein